MPQHWKSYSVRKCFVPTSEGQAKLVGVNDQQGVIQPLDQELGQGLLGPFTQSLVTHLQTQQSEARWVIECGSDGLERGHELSLSWLLNCRCS